MERLHIALWYMATCSCGFALVLVGSARASRLIFDSRIQDVFNEINETFPQEEVVHFNEYSINFDARYRLKDRLRKSTISFPNPFRGLLVTGSPGAGKSWFVILPLIRQLIEKGYSMFIYDFKYDDLSKAAYNWLQQNTVARTRTRRPFTRSTLTTCLLRTGATRLDPDSMFDITDATESARTILLGPEPGMDQKAGRFLCGVADQFCDGHHLVFAQV
jgi:hypothetical protein